MKEFTHIDAKNNPRMVDVGEKELTKRVATAMSKVWLPSSIRALFENGDIITKKGTVFHTAIIAGTMGLKQTSQLIPFCHQINIEGSKIDIELQGEHAVITCEARTFGKTGVEMEALTGAQIAALTIYDMCKSIDNSMRIESCSLLSKKGGKTDINLKDQTI